MDPIISPLWFYLIGIVENLSFAFGVSGFALVGIPIFLLSINVIKTFKSTLIVMILGGIFLLLSLFVPTKETAYQMLATSLITSDNIAIVTNGTKNLVDYIIDIAEDLTDTDVLNLDLNLKKSE